MADNVEVEQTNITVETNPAETVVEFRYYGVNEAALAALIPRVASLEDFQDQLEADVIAALAAGTGPISLQLTALQSLVNGDIAALDAEELARAAADVALGNDIQALDDYLTPLVLAEPAARDAAIAVETAARIAAISAATAPITADFVDLEATVAAYTAQIAAIDGAQVALAADFAALEADFTALSGEFATWSTDFTTVQNAVTAEITARANADAALQAQIKTTEDIQDIVGTMLVAGNNIDLTYDDTAGTLTVAVEALTSGDVGDFNEAVDDRINALLVAGSNVTLTYDDVANTMTVAAAGGGTGNVATDAIYDAKGDLPVGTGANTAARLAVGTNGQVLTADSTEATGLKWVTPNTGGASLPLVDDGATLRRSATQALTAATWAEIAWDVEVRDDNGYFSSGTPTRITIPVTGWYAMVARCRWSTTSADSRAVQFVKNGAMSVLSGTRLGFQFITSSTGNAHSVSDIQYLVAGDYITVGVYSTNSESIAGSIVPLPEFSIHRLGTASVSDFDTILTADGEVLVDLEGNILVE